MSINLDKIFQKSLTAQELMSNSSLLSEVKKFFSEKNITWAFQGDQSLALKTDEIDEYIGLNFIYRVCIEGIEKPRTKLPQVLQPNISSVFKINFIDQKGDNKILKIEKLFFLDNIGRNSPSETIQNLQNSIGSDIFILRDKDYNNYGKYNGITFAYDPDVFRKINIQEIIPDFNLDIIRIDKENLKPENLRISLKTTICYWSPEDVMRNKLATHNCIQLGMPSPFVATTQAFKKAYVNVLNAAADELRR